MSEITITREDSERHGRYVARAAGEAREDHRDRAHVRARFRTRTATCSPTNAAPTPRATVTRATAAPARGSRARTNPSTPTTSVP